MILRKKFRWIRRCEVDFWGIRYVRPRKARFFMYIKRVLRYRIRISKFFRKKSWFRRKNRGKFYKKRRFFIKKGIFPYFKIFRKKFRINLYLFFGRCNAFKAFRVFYKRKKFRQDYESLLLGIKRFKRSKRNIYFKPKKKKFFERRNHYFKVITYYYNQLDLYKLKRLGYLASKTRVGSVIQFFQFLESRLDSICLRFNIGSKYYIRHFIKSRHIMVNNKIIDNLNYIVKRFSLIGFPFILKKYIYGRLKKVLYKRLFYVQPPYYFEINYRLLLFILIPTLIHPKFVPYPFGRSTVTTLATGLHTVLWGCF